ncbi:MAG: DUF5655 domain-containing protein [Xanthomarina gelatinilytica]|uniref:DUF5655 domain-containing protein n=1 Tax=Xanthomarina gelatinilytica TaxID=1137281 RepID=UPI003A85E156
MSVIEERQYKMLQSIEEKTGLKPKVIIDEVKSQKLEKHNEIISYIKAKYNLSHGFANLLAHKSKEEAEINTEENLIELQYKGKEKLFGIYLEVAKFLKQLDSIEFAPKKAYVSIRANKQFAIIQPSTKTRLDIGLNFPKGMEIPLEPSGSFNSMVSHRIRIESQEDFTNFVKDYLIKAYEFSV